MGEPRGLPGSFEVPFGGDQEVEQAYRSYLDGAVSNAIKCTDTSVFPVLPERNETKKMNETSVDSSAKAGTKKVRGEIPGKILCLLSTA